MQTLMQFLLNHGLGAIFIVILLEYACFPVSSEIILPLSGALACTAGTPFLLLVFISTLAGLLRTGICYVIGRIGGSRFLRWITTRFPKTRGSIEYSRKKFDTLGKYAVAIGRVIPLCRTYIAFIAGASEMCPLPFFISSAIGITVWNTLLTGLGYITKENWSLVSAYYSKYKDLILPVLLIIIFIVIIVKLRKPLCS